MNQEKGYLYEIQIRDYIINSLNKMAYLWSHTPETILLQNNIIGTHNDARLKRKEEKLNPLQDTGIDIIQLEDDGKCSVVQCKNGYKKGITMSDLAGFMCWMTHLDKLHGYVYYTDKLSMNLRCLPPNPRIHYVKEPYIEPIKNENTTTEIKVFNIDSEKLKYQLVAFEEAKEYYKDIEIDEDDEDDEDEYINPNNNGIISMPCGTGKTYTSYLISQLFNQIIILSPLKQFAKQNLDKYIDYGYSSSTLLVDSDGCRDLETIKKFIKDNTHFVISSTYDSVDVIYQSLYVMTKPFFIIDEFHNLSKHNVINEDDLFYKLINTNHKKLFMSATPRVYEMENEDKKFYDVIFGDVIYNMNFKEAIDNNYITDYKIWFPSIHENTELLDKDLSIYDIDEVIKSKCKFLYSCLVNNGSRKCIVYCSDTTEMKDMMKAITILDDYYCLDYHLDYITSDVSHILRDTRLKHFADSKKIELLFSVRILDECVDIPSCDSIFITYPSESKIRTIQRLSRCTRIDSNNKFKVGNIFIWCDEYSKILNTLSGIKEYDSEFREKIKLNINGSHSHFDDYDLDNGLKEDTKLISDFLVGIKEFKCLSWSEKLEEVKKYIDENNKRPSTTSKEPKIKTLGNWISEQQKNYKSKTANMRDLIIYDTWTEFINHNNYKEYFLDNNTFWLNTLEKIKKYIDENNKRPSITSKDHKITTLGRWLLTQQKQYKSKSYVMSDYTIYDTWVDFINHDNYKEYFLDNNTVWLNTLEEIKKYINENNKRPSSTSKDHKITTLGRWLSTQQKNYKSNSYVMKDSTIYDTWTNFINHDMYKEYFLDNNTVWINTLEEVKKYIDEHNEIPSTTSKDHKLKILGNWINTQKTNYKSKNQIMKDSTIYDTWNIFIDDNKYKEYFIDNNTIWLNTLEEIKKYINENNKRPSSTSKDHKIKTLGSWINTQQKNYKSKTEIMKDSTIYDTWTNFINHDMYKEYFLDNNTVWLNTLEEVKEYIDKHNKKPSSTSKDHRIKILCNWINHQQTNYKSKNQIMKDSTIYDTWTNFINHDNYKEYFLDNNIGWINTLEEVKNYIDVNNKRPSQQDKDKEIKTLGAWINTQQTNYKSKNKIMKVSTIYDIWTDFINDYLKKIKINDKMI